MKLLPMQREEKKKTLALKFDSDAALGSNNKILSRATVLVISEVIKGARAAKAKVDATSNRNKAAPVAGDSWLKNMETFAA